MELHLRIFEILRSYGLEKEYEDVANVPLCQNVKKLIENDRPLVFLLPAFPAKSSCSEKTLGPMPDLGEVIALKNLESICQKIEFFHTKEVKIIICSDGRAFGDVVGVSDEKIDLYSEGIQKIIDRYNLKHLELFRMDDLYPELSPVELRELLVKDCSESLEQIKNKVKTNEHYKKLFNGMHRFLLEEDIKRLDFSKNAISKITKEKTYELIRRSEAWSRFIENNFTETLRLSIHPHAHNHEKFGISLVPSSSKWATPWHNVLVKIKDRYELMHRNEAIKLNATLKKDDHLYEYFEIN